MKKTATPRLVPMVIHAIILSILLTLFTCEYANAQDRETDRFTISLRTEPGLDKNTHNTAFNYGVNLGAAIEYQIGNNVPVYIKAQCFAVPELNNINYFDYEGVVGFNYRNFWDNLRAYGGVKLGLINRQGQHPKWGQELGFELYFGNFFTGLEFSNDRRTDGRITDEDVQNYWSKGYAIKIGFVL